MSTPSSSLQTSTGIYPTLRNLNINPSANRIIKYNDIKGENMDLLAGPIEVVRLKRMKVWKVVYQL